MRLFLLLGILVALIATGFFVFSSTKSNNKLKTSIEQAHRVEEDETRAINIKASFAIFTNSTFRVFSASMYHNLSQDVFIKSSNPNIVHVKKSGITWNDFFKTLPMKLTSDCLTTGTGQTFCTNKNQTLKFYINGKLDPRVLEKIISNKDQLLVTYGNESDEQITNQLQQIP